MKASDRVIPEYRALIEASLLVALATLGPGGATARRGAIVRSDL